MTCQTCGRLIPERNEAGRPSVYCNTYCRDRTAVLRTLRERAEREKQHRARVMLEELRVQTDLVARGFTVFNGFGRTWPSQLVVQIDDKLRAVRITRRNFDGPYDVLAMLLPDGRILYRGLGDCVGDADPDPEG
jgi:hypothetical protein